MLMQFSSPGNPVEQDIEYLFLAHRSVNLHSAVLSALSRKLAPLEITPVQMAIIHHCHSGDTDTVTGLTRLIPLGAGTISRHVEQLVQRGLLERVYSQEDRRTIHLLLTEEAEAMIPDIARCRRENEFVLLEGVSDEEKRVFANIVDKILDNFNRQEPPPPPTRPGPNPKFYLTDTRGLGWLDAPAALR